MDNCLSMGSVGKDSMIFLIIGLLLPGVYSLVHLRNILLQAVDQLAYEAGTVINPFELSHGLCFSRYDWTSWSSSRCQNQPPGKLRFLGIHAELLWIFLSGTELHTTAASWIPSDSTVKLCMLLSSMQSGLASCSPTLSDFKNGIGPSSGWQGWSSCRIQSIHKLEG